MADIAHKQTDDLIAKLEKKIKKEYAQAEKDAEAKLKKHLDGFAQRDKDKKKLVDAGQMTQEAYDKWRQQQILTGEKWQAMVNTLADDMANASKIAEGMTKGYMADAYALNHNFATYEVEHASKINTSYALYDKSTVERLVKENPKILPKMNPAGKTAQDIRDGKIKRWNKQKITSALTQGILQGESIDKLSRRMRSVAQMDYNASIRNARTAMTGAQNAGRLDGYERANDMGIETQKQWLAVMDDRTRHEHRMLDGQRVDVDDPFEVDGYEIMYPGDPAGDPEMVYNCRCTMICAIKGFEKDFTDRKNDDLGDMTYDKWKGMHEKAEPETETEAEAETKPVVIDTKPVRDGDEIDFTEATNGEYGKGKVIEQDDFTGSFFIDFDGKGEHEFSYELTQTYNKINNQSKYLSDEQEKNIKELVDGQREKYNLSDKNAAELMAQLQEQEMWGFSQNRLQELYDQYYQKDEYGFEKALDAEKQDELSKLLTVEKANENNFFMKSKGTWTLVEDRNDEPDHKSYNKMTGKISSEYWYTSKGVYRRSDHWGAQVASCSWNIEGRKNASVGVTKGERETAFIPWEDLFVKSEIKNDDGILIINGGRFRK